MFLFIQPTAITVKKGRSVKIALDSRALNQEIEKDKYQTPILENLQDMVAEKLVIKRSRSLIGKEWLFTVRYKFKPVTEVKSEVNSTEKDEELCEETKKFVSEFKNLFTRNGKVNKPRTAQVGVIFKVQKYSRNDYCEINDYFNQHTVPNNTRKGFRRDSKTAF